MNPPDRLDPTLKEAAHPRTFRTHTYVYPVLSRRSGGVSVGINLNPDKACNFDCIYCQVDRSKTPQERFVGMEKLVAELREVLGGLKPGGKLWSEPEFAALPAGKKRVTDIAFSGDGEPTTFKNFREVAARCVEVKEGLGFDDAKVVLITNATGLDRPDVKEALRFLDAHRGEVWAKLDAGTPEYFRLIDHTEFPFQRILENIVSCAREREIVIQSCFMRVRGSGPDDREIKAFCQRLLKLKAEGARIRLVQVYTVARPPAYGVVSSLSQVEVDSVVASVKRIAGLRAEAYYGEVEEGAGLIGKDLPDKM
ncbi:MAG: radical SAM protein [Planctomycetota bacterium]|nr:radical SAM protein [Planctomycetota bacterium]